MFSQYKKELNQFFGNASGYWIISIFVAFCALYVFFFENDFNILNSGFATLDNFFTIAPWALLFTVPALTMRSFAEENQTGTIEILFTQPLTKLQIIVAKYLSVITVIAVAIALTALFSISIQQLAYHEQSLDWGIIIASYWGLLLLSAAFAAIGIFLSSCVKNMITAYLVGLFLCFFLYFGFSNLSSYNLFGSYDYMVEKLGLASHYETICRGILALSDHAYFALIIATFLGLTYYKISTQHTKKEYGFIGVLIVFFALIFVNFGRLDVTQDKRYSLTQTTKNIAENVSEPITFEIYLDGDYPADIRKFNTEIKRHLAELQSINAKISFRTIDPFSSQKITENLKKQHIEPITKRIKTDKGAQEFLVFPYAKAIYGKKQLVFPLIKDVNQPIESNMEDIEFNFTKAIAEITRTTKPKLGVIIHHGEFSPSEHSKFIALLKNRYEVTPFMPQSAENLTDAEAESLQNFDALLVVDPKNPFTEMDREAVDQYIMKGGKTLWLLDGTTVKLDSLQQRGKSIVIGKDLGLTPLLFKYGIRVNPDLVQDYSNSAKISLVTDEYNKKPVFTDFKWFYFPVSNYAPNPHPIINNIAPVRFEFVSTIDTLDAPTVHKIPLLVSSETTLVQGTMGEVNLESVEAQPDLSSFNKKDKVLAILLEGKFPSAFTNRIHSFHFPYKDESVPTKMIVVADGDIAKNDTQYNIIGGDRSGFTYGNEDFLMNSIEYLVDKNQIFTLKNKAIKVPILDPALLQENKNFWKWFNLLIPQLVLWLLGGFFLIRRWQKYGR